ncbi:uncharacterized protein [Onthophagus taurus]|uniref:uncharacterized protein isoform X2 n=1 Tax=Onthophagus taurus TaxID=166361 RepID=UPI0039BDFC82
MRYLITFLLLLPIISLTFAHCNRRCCSSCSIETCCYENPPCCNRCNNCNCEDIICSSNKTESETELIDSTQKTVIVNDKKSVPNQSNLTVTISNEINQNNTLHNPINVTTINENNILVHSVADRKSSQINEGPNGTNVQIIRVPYYIDRPVLVEVEKVVEKKVYVPVPSNETKIIEKIVEVPIVKPVPYFINNTQYVPVLSPVDRPIVYPVQVPVDRPIPYYIPFNQTHYKYILVNVPTYIDKPIPMPYPVKHTEYITQHVPVQVPTVVEKPVGVPVPVPHYIENVVSVPIVVDKLTPVPVPFKEIQVVNNPVHIPVQVPVPYPVIIPSCQNCHQNHLACFQNCRPHFEVVCPKCQFHMPCHQTCSHFMNTNF